MVPNRASISCDESGNSGPNYIDIPQPFYVLGGWLVPDNRIVEVSVAIDEFRRKRFSQLKELKSGPGLRNDHAKKKCVELFTLLGQLHCVPLYLIAEKRFCVAGKIVETFLDPAYHAFLKDPFTWDIETKQEIANTLYENLPDSVIAQFANAYRCPTIAGLRDALLGVTSAVEAHVSPELAEAISGCRKHIDQIAAVEAETSPLGDVAGTLNMPCLVSFLMLVENLGRLGLAHPIRVLHDQQHAYKEGYERIFALQRGMPRLFARLPHDGLPFSNLEHVAEFEVRDSLDSMPIQAADLLAGALHHCCKIALRHEDPSPGDLSLAKMILPALLVPEPRLTWIICSDKLMRSLGARVFDPSVRDLVGTRNSAGECPPEPTAPMFPLKRADVRISEERERVQLDLPLFSIAAKSAGSLMIVNPPDLGDALVKRHIALFATRDLAERFLAMWDPHELSEPQEVVEYGPGDLWQLISVLEQAAEWAEVAGFDLGGSPKARFVVLSELVPDLRVVWSRIVRTFRTGMHKALVKKHKFGGVAVMSLQGRDGRYGAMIHPDGRIYFGQSRRAAVAALRESEGI